MKKPNWIIFPDAKERMEKGYYAVRFTKSEPESAVKIGYGAGNWRIFIDGRVAAVGTHDGCARTFPKGLAGRAIDFAEYMTILSAVKTEGSYHGSL